MKNYKYLFAAIVLILIAGFAFFFLRGERRALADMTSPSGDWRVEVIGTNKILGGIEIVAHVHTSDGRMTSRGVIDMLSDWEIAEFIYQEGVNSSFIDEAKARVGDMQNPTILYRDDYFPGEDHRVQGEVFGKPVEFRLGQVTNRGFTFSTAIFGMTDRDDLSVNVINFQDKLTPGAIFLLNKESPVVPEIYIFERIRDPESKGHLIGDLQNPKLKITVDQVTDNLVTGTLELRSEESNVNLSGNFRLPNELP